MAYPWCRFYQVKDDDEEPFSCMMFPAVSERRYSVTENEDGAFQLWAYGTKPAAVSVIVAKNGDVTMAVGVDAAISVKVNDSVIAKGTFSTKLNDGDRVELKTQPFFFQRVHSEIGKILEEVKPLLLCRTCNEVCDDPHLLKCGHTFCKSCLDAKLRVAMTAPGEAVVPIEGLSAILDPEELLQQSRTITCDMCHEQVACWDAVRARRPIPTAKAIQDMKKWVVYEQKRPKCAECNSSRCLADIREYEFCERCRMQLCPACAVERHLDHELRDRFAILKEMHKYGRQLAIRKILMSNLRQTEAVVYQQANGIFNELRRQMDVIKQRSQNAVQKVEQLVKEIKIHPFADVKDDLDRVQVQLDKSSNDISKMEAATVKMATITKPPAKVTK